MTKENVILEELEITEMIFERLLRETKRYKERARRYSKKHGKWNKYRQTYYIYKSVSSLKALDLAFSRIIDISTKLEGNNDVD